MTYTIKQIADLAGVTTRTIRYYDQIGLLVPVGVGRNGYRLYDTNSLFQLQQILFFKELDIPLKEIESILDQPDFSLKKSLQNHRISLEKKVNRLSTLINTINETLDDLNGGKKMAEKEIFKGFDESQFQNESKERWGKTKQYAESIKKWASYSKKQKEEIKAEGGRITVRMVGKDNNTVPDDPDVQAAVHDYQSYLNKYFYTCDTEFLRRLADMWLEDSRFAISFDHVREGGAEFVVKAVHIFCDANK